MKDKKMAVLMKRIKLLLKHKPKPKQKLKPNLNKKQPCKLNKPKPIRREELKTRGESNSNKRKKSVKD